VEQNMNMAPLNDERLPVGQMKRGRHVRGC